MFDKFSPFWILYFAYSKVFLSKGETECIFSPQDRHTVNSGMLEVNDCFVIADTIRFFSENDGVCLLRLPFQLKLTLPFSENEYYLGEVGDRLSEYHRRRITCSFQQLCPTIISHPIMLPWFILLASRAFGTREQYLWSTVV